MTQLNMHTLPDVLNFTKGKYPLGMSFKAGVCKTFAFRLAFFLPGPFWKCVTKCCVVVGTKVMKELWVVFWLSLCFWLFGLCHVHAAFYLAFFSIRFVVSKIWLSVAGNSRSLLFAMLAFDRSVFFVSCVFNSSPFNAWRHP